MPKTVFGKWSLVLVAAAPILFFAGSLLANIFYSSIPAGNSILEDLALRPVLALAMLAGMLSGIGAGILGLLAIIRQKERSPLVYLATLLGALLVIFLLGEVLFPH